MEGQLALLSPSILATGLRYAGTPMSCMRTSELVDSYRRNIGKEPYKNWSWYGYFCGWGFSYASSLFGVMAFLSPDKEWIPTAASALAIATDVMWGATNIYALIYARKLSQNPAAQPAAKMSVVPVFDMNGHVGLVMQGGF
jgi:hypothetical protein